MHTHTHTYAYHVCIYADHKENSIHTNIKSNRTINAAFLTRERMCTGDRVLLCTIMVASLLYKHL